MKGFGAFVDFASSTGNQTTTLWFESTSIPFLQKNRLPGPAATYFWEYFYLMANNGMFWIQFL
jgi:hypothetical protein